MDCKRWRCCNNGARPNRPDFIGYCTFKTWKIDRIVLVSVPDESQKEYWCHLKGMPINKDVKRSELVENLKDMLVQILNLYERSCNACTKRWYDCKDVKMKYFLEALKKVDHQHLKT